MQYHWYISSPLVLIILSLITIVSVSGATTDGGHCQVSALEQGQLVWAGQPGSESMLASSLSPAGLTLCWQVSAASSWRAGLIISGHWSEWARVQKYEAEDGCNHDRICQFQLLSVKSGIQWNILVATSHRSAAADLCDNCGQEKAGDTGVLLRKETCHTSAPHSLSTESTTNLLPSCNVLYYTIPLSKRFILVESCSVPARRIFHYDYVSTRCQQMVTECHKLGN